MQPADDLKERHKNLIKRLDAKLFANHTMYDYHFEWRKTIEPTDGKVWVSLGGLVFGFTNPNGAKIEFSIQHDTGQQFDVFICQTNPAMTLTKPNVHFKDLRTKLFALAQEYWEHKGWQPNSR